MAEIIRREPRTLNVAGADNTRPIRTYPVIRCTCGVEVHCHDSWANTCDCGKEYNGSGQTLAPRSHWGEETGEDFY